MSAQFGYTEIVRILLDAGEHPNRYNPLGFHGHSTPLHKAAFAGHEETVRLLVERGARLDMKDTLWQDTPEGWAAYGGKTQIAGVLARTDTPDGETLTSEWVVGNGCAT
ncbi:MAG: ankyrin repeat domain-containing protein [Candidatus Acidiferrales bacterium]